VLPKGPLLPHPIRPTTAIGVGATTASVVAQTSFMFPATPIGPTELFNNLFLPPNTYYLVIGVPSTAEFGEWHWSSMAKTKLGKGVTATASYTSESGLDYAFNPDSPFVLNSDTNGFAPFLGQIDGSGPVPEPSTALLLVFGTLPCPVSCGAALAEQELYLRNTKATPFGNTRLIGNLR
jgi:hypothetical protein